MDQRRLVIGLVIGILMCSALFGGIASSQINSPTRTLSSSSVTPGEEVTVTVEADVSASTPTITESFSPTIEEATITQVTVDGQEASTLVRAADESGIVVTFNNVDEDSTVRIQYTVRVSNDADVGSTYELTGDVSAGETRQTGSDTITVEEPAVDIREAPTTVSPDSEATVTLETTAETSTITLNESFTPAFETVTLGNITVDGQEVTPLIGAGDTNGVVVTLSGLSEGSVVRISYRVSVAANATPGETYTISGDITDNGTSIIASSDLTVKEGSPLEGVAGQYDGDYDGNISIAELGVAAVDYANGGLQIAELGEVAAAYATS